MKRSSAAPMLLMASMFLYLSVAFSQSAAQQSEYAPTVGQSGKDVVWVPTMSPLVDKMLDIAKVTDKDVLIDLGSGDGRTVIAAAKRGARAMGIEFNPDMVELSKKNAAKEGMSQKATFMVGDIFKADFSQASIITMFLLPDINLRLRPKILDLKPGTRIVSNTFTMGEWEADDKSGIEEASDEAYGSYNTALLWIVPAKVEGLWSLSTGGEMTLNQKFQMVQGMVKTNSKSIPVLNGRLRGDQIRFMVADAEYAGTVKEQEMRGTMTVNGKGSPWSATLRPQPAAAAAPSTGKP